MEDKLKGCHRLECFGLLKCHGTSPAMFLGSLPCLEQPCLSSAMNSQCHGGNQQAGNGIVRPKLFRPCWDLGHGWNERVHSHIFIAYPWKWKFCCFLVFNFHLFFSWPHSYPLDHLLYMVQVSRVMPWRITQPEISRSHSTADNGIVLSLPFVCMLSILFAVLQDCINGTGLKAPQGHIP